MSRSFPRLALVAVLTALLVGLLSPASQAASTPRVKGVSKAGQDGSSLVVRWRPVSGATYQLRWAGTAKALRRGAVVSTPQTSAATGALSRGGKWFAQVRAIRSGRAGAWSRPKAMKLQGGQAAASAQPISGQGVPGGVRFAWNGFKGAARYRVEWNAGWSGMWPGTTYVDNTPGGWVGAGARSSTLAIPGAPGPGDRLLSVEYGNPVFARLQSAGRKGGVQRSTRWVHAYPTPPTPADGDGVRMGTYNVELLPTGGPRISAMATNIATHGVDLVALQEATIDTGRALSGALGPQWATAPTTGTTQTIIYRTDKYRLLSSGSYSYRNPRNPAVPLLTPWLQLQHQGVGNARPFFVTSVHFSAPNAGQEEINRQTGLAAQEAAAAMDAANPRGLPILMGGDLQYGREPMTERADILPAQPTLVRRGYYDTMAALSRVGSEFSTVNPGKALRQTPNPTGVAGRTDHILTKNLRGAVRFENVHSWSLNGLVPSDHNLVIADLRIPRL